MVKGKAWRLSEMTKYRNGDHEHLRLRVHGSDRANQRIREGEGGFSKR